MIIVSALSLSLRDEEREREKREIELDKKHEKEKDQKGYFVFKLFLLVQIENFSLLAHLMLEESNCIKFNLQPTKLFKQDQSV